MEALKADAGEEQFQSAPWLEATENFARDERTDALARFQSAPWLEATENHCRLRQRPGGMTFQSAPWLEATENGKLFAANRLSNPVSIRSVA